jgi:hypothetical protein
MSGCLAARPPFKREVLAFGLCILAFVFAFEAKLAWYSPPGDPGIQISAAKALRADSPSMISHDNSAPGRDRAQGAVFMHAMLTAVFTATGRVSPKRIASSAEPSVLLSIAPVPTVDFRPPPKA